MVTDRQLYDQLLVANRELIKLNGMFKAHQGEAVTIGEPLAWSRSLDAMFCLSDAGVILADAVGETFFAPWMVDAEPEGES